MKKSLSMTVIFDGGNLNFGESTGNMASIKKFKQKGKTYTYMSRQALRYDIVRIMHEYMSMPESPVRLDKSVVQFAIEATPEKFVEVDLFGYMKTNVGKKDKKDKKEETENDEVGGNESGSTFTRKACVRINDAISLEPYMGEVSFSTNAGLSSRFDEENKNMIFNAETHRSLYTYTFTIDLDKIGKDDNYKVNLDGTEKARRVNMLLEAIKILYRDIRGYREDLSPIFVIGGMYNIGNPLFYNKLKVNYEKGKAYLNVAEIEEIMNKEFLGEKVGNSTLIGSTTNEFVNISDFNSNILTVDSMFKNISKQVEEYYKD